MKKTVRLDENRSPVAIHGTLDEYHSSYLEYFRYNTSCHSMSSFRFQPQGALTLGS